MTTLPYDFAFRTEVMLLAHLAINITVGGICLRRLRIMVDVRPTVKVQYVLLLIASAANGLSPVFFRQWPTIVSVFYASVVLYVLVSDSFQWRKGPPEAAKTCPGKLGDH